MLKSFLVLFALLAVLLGLTGCGGALTNAVTGSPVILAISPNPAPRGTVITITGTNLNGTLTTVYFTGVSNVNSTASSGSTTSVTVVVPSSIPAGTYNVFVTTNDGQGDISADSNFVTLSVS